MSHRICITVGTVDRNRFELAAHREGRSVADWLREAAEVRWRRQTRGDALRPVPPGTWEGMLGSSHERDPLAGRDGRWGLGTSTDPGDYPAGEA